MKLMKTALAVAVLAAPTFAFGAEYVIDSGHSGATFAVKHMVVSTVRGSFGKTEGTLVIDDADITKSSVTATIDVNTINTNEPKRDEHLRGADFFDTAKFPTITFKSTKVEKAGEGKLKVTGDLTIHGVTKPVVLDVEGPSSELKDPWGNFKRGASATTKINRKDFGLIWNKTLDTGGLAVGEEVAITIDLELNKKVAPAAAPAAAPAKGNK